MELKRDDWVNTESGEVGKVVHISRLTVFVAHLVPCKEDRVEAYLEGQLTKIERQVPFTPAITKVGGRGDG